MHFNWQAVCTIGRESPALMHAILTIDSKSQLGKELAAIFPDCWSTKPTKGPVPLSAIIAKARAEDPEVEIEDGISSTDVVNEFDLPRLEFSNDPPQFRYLATKDGVVLPEDVEKQCCFCQVVKLNGQDYFVIYSSLFSKGLSKNVQRHVDLVLAECIAADL